MRGVKGSDARVASPPTLTALGVTRREREVLAALAERLTNAELAARLSLSERTVESHVSSLLRKLNSSNRQELAVRSKELLPDATTAGPTPLPSMLALLSDAGRHVGREEQSSHLDQVWRRVVAGQTLMFVLAGEAGIGKSRLVAELAARLHGEGNHVLLGSCTEGSQQPYEPFAQAIQADLETFSARAGVLSDLHGYLRRAAVAPTLLVVEDVHWATATTLDALRHIARTGGPEPLLIVLTARDVAPDLDDALTVFLADLAPLPTVEQIRLTGLAPHEIAELVGALGSDADPAEVGAQTDGNPLLIREVVSRHDVPVGGSLTGLLLRRYGLLDDESLAVLDVAAVLGATFDADVLAAAADRSPGETLESLDRAADVGLVVCDQGRPMRWSFIHALFRAARYEQIPPSRRMSLHWSVALALRDRTSDPTLRSELARHACIAAPVGDPRSAIAWAIDAAASAEASLAFSEAADHYRQAIEVADLLRPPDPALRLRLTIHLGELLQAAGDPSYREILATAARTARAAGDAQTLAEVAWAMMHYGTPGIGRTEHPDLASVAEDALRAIGPEPSATRARTLAVVAEELCLVDGARAAVLAHEARAIARQLDDPITLGHVLLSYRIAARTPDNVEARHSTADELIGIGQRTGRSTFTILGLWARAWSAREAGDLAAADAAIDQSLALRGDRTLPGAYVAAGTLFRSTSQALSGDLATSERTAATVLGMATNGFDPTHWHGPTTAMLRHTQARLPELIPLLEAAADERVIGTVYRAGLAVAYAHAGRVEDARTIVQEMVADDLGSLPWNFTWLATLVALAEAAELTAESTAARILAGALEPYSGRLADLPQGVIAPVDFALAQLALTRGELAEAAGWATTAIAASRARRTPIFLARELVRLAAAVAGRSDVEPIVAEALTIADHTGALLVRREAEWYELIAPS